MGIYKFFNKKAPEYLSEMYQKTRSSFQKLTLPHRTTNRGLHMLSYLGPRLWNGLHTDIKSVSNANNFKHKIKDNFFILLQKNEDNPYIYY